MGPETNDPALGGAGVQLGGEPGPYKAQPLKTQGRTVLKEADFGHLIGSPRVIIDRDNSKAVVWVAGKPWGWSDPTIEFLNPASPGVDRYAQELLGRIRAAGEREANRKARQREAKLRGDL